jgi:hypothetical protein
MDWMNYQLQNQKMLQKIYWENRYKIQLAKNRIEKFRAREKKKLF